MSNDEYFEDEEFRELLNEYEQAARSGQSTTSRRDNSTKPNKCWTASLNYSPTLW